MQSQDERERRPSTRVLEKRRSSAWRYGTKSKLSPTRSRLMIPNATAKEDLLKRREKIPRVLEATSVESPGTAAGEAAGGTSEELRKLRKLRKNKSLPSRKE